MNNFFNRENTGLVIFIISLSLGYKYYNITENTTKIFIIFWFLIFIFYNLLFKFKETERFLIKNISIIIFLSLLFIFYNQNKLGLSNNELFIIIGGTFAFWYGYKKYERDKELEIIEKYTKKYNEIGDKNDINNYNKILDLWYEEFYLFNQGYISKNLWNEWETWIYIDIYEIIKYEANNNYKGNFFYTLFIKKYLPYNASINIKNENNINFIKFIKNNFDSLFYSAKIIGKLNIKNIYKINKLNIDYFEKLNKHIPIEKFKFK
ncbi:MAG: hypothetical protein PHI37_02490 [Candidatus Gracilibacteria bacterium]|nr:hypothetical protein [Candidatus Gracilibacteria bacterium]